MCVKEIVVETCDTCLRYTPPSAMTIFGLRISNITQIRMWLHPPVYHCRFPATFSRLGLLFSQLQPRLLHWPTSICAGVTILSMSQSTGQHSSCKKNWDNCTCWDQLCLFIAASPSAGAWRTVLVVISWHCPLSVTCPLIVQGDSHKGFQHKFLYSGSPCPCAWHQQSLMLHVLAALCMTTYSMHTLVS